MTAIRRNAWNVAKNPFQGTDLKVLTVCSAGVLRSPTAAWVLSNKPFGFNTRSCGSSADFALIPLSPELLVWADEIVCMETDHALKVKEMMSTYNISKQLHTLHIPDNYEFRNSELVDLITTKCKELFKI